MLIKLMALAGCAILDSGNTSLPHQPAPQAAECGTGTSPDALQRIHEEQGAFIEKSSEGLNASLATIKGLCEVATKEEEQKLPSYIQKVESVAEQLIEELSKLRNIRENHSRKTGEEA